MTPPTPTDSLPPYSPEAEQAVLGAILQDGHAALDVVLQAGATPDWFFDHRFRNVFDVVLKIARDGRTVDYHVIYETLKATPDILNAAGGLPGLGQWMNESPLRSRLPLFIDTLRDKWRLRRVIAACSKVCAQAMTADTGPDVGAFVNAAAETVHRATAEVTTQQDCWDFRPAVQAALAHIEHYHKGGLQIDGLPTGLDYMDKVLGGIPEDGYVVLAGRPGSGKTTLALNIVSHLTLRYEHTNEAGLKQTGIPVGVFSLEMSAKSLGRRMLFGEAQVSAGKFKQGFMSNADLQALLNTAPQVAGARIALDSQPSQTISQIAAKARRMVREFGVKCFVLDYLQLVLPDRRSGRIDRVQELTDISAQFVQLKKDLNVPWIILAQMNRNIEQAESHRVPVMSDLRDCGAIEQDSDAVLFLYFPERKRPRKGEDPPPDDTDLIFDHYTSGGTRQVEWSELPQRINGFVAKNRDGATGKIELLFHKNQFRFEDWHAWKVRHGHEQANKGERIKPASPPPAQPDEWLPPESNDP